MRYSLLSSPYCFLIWAMKSGSTLGFPMHETCMVSQRSLRPWWVSKKYPEVRVGFPISTVVALLVDIEPAADLKTASGIPDASSATNSTRGAWIPARASGLSAELVLADMKQPVGMDLRRTCSVVVSKSSLRKSGSLESQSFTSAIRPSNSVPAAGAVQITLHSPAKIRVWIMAQARPVVFPTPWPDRTDSRRTRLVQTRSSSSSWKSLGVAPSTSRTNRPGRPRYLRAKGINGFCLAIGSLPAVVLDAVVVAVVEPAAPGPADALPELPQLPVILGASQEPAVLEEVEVDGQA